MPLPFPPAQVVVASLGTQAPKAAQTLSTKGVRLVQFTMPTASNAAALVHALQDLAVLVRDVGASALNNPFASSVLVLGQTFSANVAVNVTHYLGRPVTTWMAMRPREPKGGPALTTGAPIFEINPQPTNLNQAHQIQLAAVANCTVDLLFA